MVGVVEGIDRKEGCVWLQRGGRLFYDYLIVALGGRAHRPWPGAAEHTLDILWPESALEAGRSIFQAVQETKRGTTSIAMVLAPGSPIYCPAYEMVLLLHEQLRRMGLRERIRLHLLTAEQAPFAWIGLPASQVVEPWLARCNIEFHGGVEPARFEACGVVLRKGGTLRADRMVLFPPYRGPQALEGLQPLVDREGFMVVTRSMRSVVDERIWAAGDVISAPGAKTGHLAENQGVVAAREVARAIRADGAMAAWDSRLLCVIDGGGENRGLMAMARPKPGETERPSTQVLSGPVFRWAKQALERYYLTFRV